MEFNFWRIIGAFCILIVIYSGVSVATEIRLHNLGNINYVFEDESNQLNYWDFFNNPAGLWADEEGHTLKFSGSFHRFLQPVSVDYSMPPYSPSFGNMLIKRNSYGARGVVRFDSLAFLLEVNYLYFEQESRLDSIPQNIIIYPETEHPFKDGSISYPYLKMALNYHTHQHSVGFSIRYQKAKYEKHLPFVEFLKKRQFFEMNMGYINTYGPNQQFGIMLNFYRLQSFESANNNYYSFSAFMQGLNQLSNQIQLAYGGGIYHLADRYREYPSPGREDEKVRYAHAYQAIYRTRLVWNAVPEYLNLHVALSNSLSTGIQVQYNEALDPNNYYIWNTDDHFMLGFHSAFLDGSFSIGGEAHLDHSPIFQFPTPSSGLKMAGYRLGMEWTPVNGYALQAGFLRDRLSTNPEYEQSRYSPPGFTINEQIKILSLGWSIHPLPVLKFESGVRWWRIQPQYGLTEQNWLPKWEAAVKYYLK